MVLFICPVRIYWRMGPLWMGGITSHLHPYPTSWWRAGGRVGPGIVRVRQNCDPNNSVITKHWHYRNNPLDQTQELKTNHSTSPFTFCSLYTSKKHRLVVSPRTLSLSLLPFSYSTNTKLAKFPLFSQQKNTKNFFPWHFRESSNPCRIQILKQTSPPTTTTLSLTN